MLDEKFYSCSGEFEDFFKDVMAIENKKRYKMHLPAEYEKEYCGPLYGYLVQNTGIFNVVIPEAAQSGNASIRLLGNIEPAAAVNSASVDDATVSHTGNIPALVGIRDGEKLVFEYDNENVPYETYSFIADAFSRTIGIVESSIMINKKAVIVGCGSGGSFITLELAKVGVGRFLLIDNDEFAYHNISRHQCGVYDVGKKKVDAIKERILAINPRADVVIYSCYVQDIYREELVSQIDKDSILLCCGDNRASAHYCNKLSQLANVPFIAAGAGHRASTGEIFYYIPNMDMPCYSCAFGEDISKNYSNEDARIWYDTQSAERKADFEPGLITDIDYISVIVVKLAIDLLLKDQPNYTKKLLDYMSQYTALCNYLGDVAVNPMMAIFSHPLEILAKKIPGDINSGDVITTCKRDDCYLCKILAEIK